MITARALQDMEKTLIRPHFFVVFVLCFYQTNHYILIASITTKLYVVNIKNIPSVPHCTKFHSFDHSVTIIKITG